ncbi:uncharacterized protein [Arachis hypogaea]|uniref:uncharacterized protein n=1 Tax=Arachis hypogaea TaxID=3818 RepID=UPI00110574EC|nr:uncharacterized protein LOC114925150 [Arachis hypogaea]
MNSPGNGLIISRMLSRLLMKTYLAMTKTEDFDDMDKRLKDIEDETAALKEMQAKVKKEMGSVQDLGTASASQVNREEIDSRSVFVGNVSSLIPSLLEKFLCCLAVFSSPLMIWTKYINVLTSFEDIK